jgi:FkbM family methyltransferase
MLSLRARADEVGHLLKAISQQHHRELIAPFAPHVPRDAVVFDVGAHAGQFSKLFARMAPDGQVYAFEPSAYARSILKQALTWNRIGNVEVVPMGLSDAEGSLVLHTPIKKRGGVGFGLAHLGADTGDRPVMDQTVTLTTLDGFARGKTLKRLDFIKADVEGWEAHVLRGGAETIAAFRPTLYLEVVEASLARAGSTPREIWERLTSLGYRAHVAPDFTPVEAYGPPTDYLFVA